MAWFELGAVDQIVCGPASCSFPQCKITFSLPVPRWRSENDYILTDQVSWIVPNLRIPILLSLNLLDLPMCSTIPRIILSICCITRITWTKTTCRTSTLRNHLPPISPAIEPVDES